MIFNESKPIAKQVEEYCRSRISTEHWKPDSRIPSTRDLALQLGINPRTVMKAYDILVVEGVIYQRRGVGYFVSDNAMKALRDERIRTFLKDKLPEIAREIYDLKIDMSYVTQILGSLVGEIQNEN